MCDSSANRRWACSNLAALSLRNRGTKRCVPAQEFKNWMRITDPISRPQVLIVLPPQCKNSRHVRAIPWPSERWRAVRHIDTGHAGLLHDREHARGHVPPRCRGGGGVGRGNGYRPRHRSGGGPLAWRSAHGRDRHPAAQRTCARQAGRPIRRTCGRVGSTAARWGASNRTGECCQQPPTRRRNRSRRAGTITRGSSWALRSPEVAARGRRAQLGALGGGRGAAAARAL